MELGEVSVTKRGRVMNRILDRVRRIALLCSVVLLANLIFPSGVKGASADFSKKTARLIAKTLTLNGSRESDTAETYVVFNVSGDYALEGLPASSDDVRITQDKILSYNGLPAVRLIVSADNNSGKGVHIYTITPIERNSGDKLNPLKLRVKIVKKYAPVGFQKKVIYLNKNTKGEFALNSPTLSGAVIMPLNSEKYKPSIPSGVQVSLDNENTVRVSLGNTKVTTAKGKTKDVKSFRIKLWIGYADYEDFKAVSKTFTVKVAEGSPGVKLIKKAGSRIDLSQREATSLHYVPGVLNSGYVVKNVELPDSMSDKFTLRTVSDPDNEAITDIYISAKKGAKIDPGSQSAGLKLTLQEPRQDAETFEKTANIRFAVKTSKLTLKAVDGKKLSISQSISDDYGVSYKEVMVTGKSYARIDPDSIEEIASDKLPKGAVNAEWEVDGSGQAARIIFTIDKKKLTEGKSYKLKYKVRAVGAPSNKYTIMNFGFKL